MEARYETRKQELLEECHVAPQVFDRVMPRLVQFMKPFVDSLARREQVQHAETFVQGLLSDVEHKNTESIAYRFGQERMPLQWFIGVSDWDDRPLRAELARQVGTALGEPDGVIVFDPSAFPKSGRASVGVARQWCGRLGKVDNCQVAVYMGYASRHEHALVDLRLYLPQEWTKDPKRRQKAGIPQGVRYRTRHQLCLEMLKEHGETLPHAWIAGDDEMGRPYWFRRRLDRLGERYLLSVASNTLIRDLEVDPPASAGRGRKPKRPWTRVDRWAASCRDADWTEINVRDGAQGPLIVEMVKRRVVARTDKRQEGHEEVLVVIRYKDREDQSVVKTDYYRLVQRRRGDRTGGVGPRGQSGTAHRRMPSAGQERSRAGRLRGSQLERLVSPSNALPHRHVVSGDGSASGKKNGPLRSRFPRSAKASPRSCIANADAIPPRASPPREHND